RPVVHAASKQEQVEGDPEQSVGLGSCEGGVAGAGEDDCGGQPLASAPQPWCPNFATTLQKSQ
ncbi:hypothetical protein PIB30_111413, partial [Stylosanthes scabra]|nr:hypothetical protein [Stylosanthes scabra]